jgi:hypothetical protein
MIFSPSNAGQEFSRTDIDGKSLFYDALRPAFGPRSLHMCTCVQLGRHQVPFLHDSTIASQLIVLVIN